MATNIGFVLSALIAVGIIFIGGRFLAAPSLAATGYGVPAGTEPHSWAYLSANGIRDIASGLFAAIPIRTPAWLVYAGRHYYTYR
jgi:Domain of unknown function (DUF4267)